MNSKEREALLDKGLDLHKRGSLDDAAKIYQEILSIDPEHLDALQLLATLKGQIGDHAVALTLFDEVIRLRPDYAGAFNNRGNALKRLKRVHEAIESYDVAIRLKPDYADAFNNRGAALLELKRFEEALASYDNAIRLRGDNAEAFYNRGMALHRLMRFEEALVSYNESIKTRPNNAETLYNRGVTLHETGRLDEALQSYDEAIRIRPGYANALCNRGVTLHGLKRFDEALSSYDRAIEMQPDHVLANYNKSLVLLLMGRMPEGWELYEWRLRRDNRKDQYLHDRQKFWRGKESLEGKSILISAEQGLGDSIQFCRYLPMIHNLGAKIIFSVHRPLVGVMTTLLPSITIISHGDPIPEFDVYCPLMSLPHAFGTSLTTIPGRVPYLSADPVKAGYWRQRLGELTNFRVGLVWNGGFRPDQPEVWATNERRNIPVKAFAPFFQHPHIDFFSLQKGEPAESEIGGREGEFWPQGNFRNYAGELSDFSDTAALIENLDLVISVDTSTAHLSGALGKPTWLLNRYGTCWRWLEDREDSPWYPSVRLFRQQEPRNWVSVLDRVSRELSSIAKAAR